MAEYTETADTEGVTHSPALPTLKELSNALDAVVDWHTLGIQLGLESDELLRIEKDYPHDSARCKSEMLACCLRSSNPPNWKAVVDALCQMKDHQSAYKIRRKHLKSVKGPRVGHSPKDKAVLLAAENLRKIKHMFASLLALAHRKLQGRNLDLDNFLVFLAALYTPDDDSNDARAVDTSSFITKVLGTAQNLGKIFAALSSSRVLDFKNYDVLCAIIDEYASDDQELQQKVCEYDQALAGFVLVTEMECYLDVELHQHEEAKPDPEMFDELSYKIGENVTAFTLQYISEIWQSLARRLKLPRSALLLDKIAEGCVQLTFLIPFHLTRFAIRRAKESMGYFRELQVLQVTIAGQCVYEAGAPLHDNDQEEERGPGRKDDPDENSSVGLQTPVVNVEDRNISEGTDPRRKRDPDVGNLEDPQAAGDIHEEEPLLVENVSQVKDPNGGRPADLDDGNLPTPEDFEDPSNVEHKDEAEALPEHMLRLKSALVISSNYSLLWQYLDPSQLLPTLLEKFLITEEMKKEAESYSRYAQTSIILRALFDDYCPGNRIYKLCDTLDTIPGQEQLGRKLLQDCKHPSPLSAYSRFPSIPATHSDFSDISQQFQQLELEAIDLLDQLPNALAKLKQVLVTLVFPRGGGKVVPLIDPRSYENALTVQELFRLLAYHWNPLSIDLLGLLLEASGCSMAATKLAEFVEARDSKAHLVLCVRQMPSLVHFQSVHRAPLSKLQSLHHSLFVQLPNRRVTSSQNTIRISVEVDTNLVCLADYERITTVLSGLFWMPKAAFVFAGVLENSSVLCWLTFPEFLACSWTCITDISGCRLLAETGITRIAVGGWFYQCPTIKEVELWEASCYGLLDTAILLTISGTNVNVATRIGVTPLFIASWKGHHDIVECLLRANADVNPQGKDSESPLFIACQENHGEIVDRLLIAKADVNLQREDGTSPLFMACQENHGEIVDRLLIAKADVNLQKEDGGSPLYVACQENHGEIVERLLIAKADINLHLEDGSTPLMVASSHGHSSVLRILLQAGATVNTTSQNGRTALMWASLKGHPSVVRILLQAGSTVNSAAQKGFTALHYAASSQHEDIVKFLIEVDADPDLQDEDQETAVMLAAEMGSVGIVRMLIRRGANVNLTNKDGLTAFDLARLRGHAEVCQELFTARPHVADQEEEDEPQPPQPFEWTESCCSPTVVVSGQEEEGEEPQPPQPFERTEYSNCFVS